jgi:5-methylcytosine-specific restriction endonuclease McrBC GTP-binding regulatory subunit McrB
MPPNLSILATMNTSDQSLFPMDSAFKRRWDWEYIPISYNRDDENKSSKFIVDLDDGTYFSWLEFIEKVNIRIKSNPNLGMDKCIGNYFINPTDNTISLNTFINKAIFYLWNDVFKDEFGSNSIFAENVTYEDFFPVKDNGAKMVIALLEMLNFKLSDGKYTVLNEDTN